MEKGEVHLPNVTISESHIHALNNGAVITLPFLLPEINFSKYGLAAGRMVTLHSQAGNASVRCRILDIESTRALDNSLYSVRITLRKSRDAN